MDSSQGAHQVVIIVTLSMHIVILIHPPSKTYFSQNDTLFCCILANKNSANIYSFDVERFCSTPAQKCLRASPTDAKVQRGVSFLCPFQSPSSYLPPLPPFLLGNLAFVIQDPGYVIVDIVFSLALFSCPGCSFTLWFILLDMVPFNSIKVAWFFTFFIMQSFSLCIDTIRHLDCFHILAVVLNNVMKRVVYIFQK